MLLLTVIRGGKRMIELSKNWHYRVQISGNLHYYGHSPSMLSYRPSPSYWYYRQSPSQSLWYCHQRQSSVMVGNLCFFRSLKPVSLSFCNHRSYSSSKVDKEIKISSFWDKYDDIIWSWSQQPTLPPGHPA